ncbi:hypothetical protein GCM10023195_87330 [Actinoallomurus liliacearum]|uniref:TIGR04222 domain-containing membrane protein n=1 Tax=Actinoallomurus liliacearum TaxID=1080073 RepID=A0ABP8U198_9ACTN
MTPDHDLSPYDVAYLFAGPDRVAVVALVGLHADGRVRITADRHRVYAEARDGELHPVETAALALIPDVGRVLGLTRMLITFSPAVTEVGRRLYADGLLPGSRLSGLWRRDRIRRIRSLRRELAEAPEGLMRVAVRGVAGIADDGLRTIFETHVYTPPAHSPLTNPKRDRPVDLLQPDTRLNDAASGYADGMDGGGMDAGGGW